MSAELQLSPGLLTPASPETLEKLKAVHEALAQFEQIPVVTEHLIHGGMYARTIRLEAGAVIEGALVRLPTLLIVHGSVSMLVGDSVVELEGYHVLPGCAGRKQVFFARTAVEMTMVFSTQTKAVADAEDEVFAEAEMLMSRRDGTRDTITITGE